MMWCEVPFSGMNCKRCQTFYFFKRRAVSVILRCNLHKCWGLKIKLRSFMNEMTHIVCGTFCEEAKVVKSKSIQSCRENWWLFTASTHDFQKTLEYQEAKTNHDLQCATPDLFTSLCSTVMALLVQRVTMRVLVMKESTTVLPRQIRTRVSEQMKLNIFLPIDPQRWQDNFVRW